MQRVPKKIESDMSPFHVLEMQELERKRISNEIHDTTVQNLTTLIHKTEYITMLLDKDLVKVKFELNTMTDIIRSCIDELREIIYDLRPMTIDDLGLVDTLERYINQMKLETENIEYEFDVVNEENRNILPIVNLTIFRIVQEALINAKKHASPKHVKVQITYLKKNLIITVIDDGKGFDVKAIDKKVKSFGLTIMKERVKLLSGILKCDSQLNCGTKIEVRIPILEEVES